MPIRRTGNVPNGQRPATGLPGRPAPPPITRSAVSQPRAPGAVPPPLGAPRVPGGVRTGGAIARPPPPLPPSSRKPNLPPAPRENEGVGDDATSIMSRPQIDARVRQMQQPSVAQRARPSIDVVPQTQRAGVESTATAMVPPQGQRPPMPRPPTGPGRPPAMPGTMPGTSVQPRGAPESAGAIALPRPPVQGGPSSVGPRTSPGPFGPGAPGTVRTTGSVARKPGGSLPPTPNYGSAPPPRSAEPPPLDDLVPRSRSERPRHTRPPVSHRSQPPRDRPRFMDRSPEPRAPGGGLPGPDSFGRIPAPVEPYQANPGDFPRPSNFPPANSNPEETMAMARGPYAAPPANVRSQTADYYPPPQSRSYPPPAMPPQTSRSYAPPAPDTYRDQRDPNEYYPHLTARSQPPPGMQAGPASASYDRYPPPGYLPPGNPQARTLPASAIPQGAIPSSSHGRPAPAESRLPMMGGAAPYPYVAPPLEAPSFMGLVLFAAPLALATLAVAALALM